MRRELYEIHVGEVTYRFCNGDANLDHGGHTWLQETIGRSEFAQGAEMNRQGITIRVPRDNPVAALYLAETPDVVATVTVLRLEGATALVWWKGRIAAYRAAGLTVSLECESVFTSMRRTGARARYQIQCRHALYGTACGVNQDSHAVAGTVSAIAADGVTLTVTGADSEDDGYFVGGMILFGGVFRFVVSHVGTTIRLWRPMPGLDVAAGVTLYPGCNRTLEHCDERFGNAANFGGFPWLPTSNPFQFINIY